MKIPLGISACVYGHKVRFDGGHKTNRFCREELSEFCEFHPVCPEVGIGLPSPRPAIHLVRSNNEERLMLSKDHSIDYTDDLLAYTGKKLPALAAMCGFVVCAKSPTCGMERVKLYKENGQKIEGGTVGIFTRKLQEAMPWLPIEEDGRLQDAVLRENFVIRVMALHDWYKSTNNLTAHNIIQFHARYKYLLMAYSLAGYKAMGQLVADISNHDIHAFADEYRLQLMTVLKKPANRKGHTNVLQHMQGYFKRVLTSEQKADLAAAVMRYYQGYLPLLAPLTLINHYLKMHPNAYLNNQVYLSPYPEELKLRYAM